MLWQLSHVTGKATCIAPHIRQGYERACSVNHARPFETPKAYVKDYGAMSYRTGSVEGVAGLYLS